MKYFIMLLLGLSSMLASCDDFQILQIDAKTIKKLNSEVAKGIKDSMVWTSSPEHIARHLFPPVSQDGKPKRYEIIKQTNTTSNCKVTIIEEGAIDDEVIGQRHTLFLEFNKDQWEITNVELALKKRF